MKISNLKKLLLLGLGAYSSVNNQVGARSLPLNEFKDGPLNSDILDIHSTDMTNLSNIKYQPPTMVYDDLSRISRIYDANTKDTDLNGIFEERTEEMIEDHITNQISQILNYQKNYQTGEKQLVSLLANCGIALKKYNTNKDTEIFNKSLDDTVNALNNSAFYEEYLNNLQVNDRKSFIVAPLTSRTHLFTFVFYKRQHKDGKIFFEVVAVNKGGLPHERGDGNKLHSMYESYEIPLENLKEVAGMLGYHKNINVNTNEILSTGEVYEKLKNLTINKDWSTLGDTIASPQIVGNCYYKELEAGLKYAYSLAYNRWRLIADNSKCFRVPKWPVETKQFQKTLIENIKDVIDEFPLDDAAKMRIKQHTDKMLTRYEKSKAFKKELAKDKYLDNYKIFNAFATHFGNSKITTIEDLKDKDALKEALRNVDFKTVNKYKDFFLYILEKSELEVPQFFKDSLKENNVIQSVATYMFESKDSDCAFVREYFESVYDIAKEEYGRLVKQEANKQIHPPKELPKNKTSQKAKDMSRDI